MHCSSESSNTDVVGSWRVDILNVVVVEWAPHVVSFYHRLCNSSLDCQLSLSVDAGSSCSSENWA